MRRSNPIHFLRAVALVEAGSFLILLGIAMPLKYFAGMPKAVSIVGMLHGVLVIVLILSLIQTTLVAKWPIGRALMVFVSSLIPFGPMVIDNRMRSYAREFRAKAREESAVS